MGGCRMSVCAGTVLALLAGGAGDLLAVRRHRLASAGRGCRPGTDAAAADRVDGQREARIDVGHVAPRHTVRAEDVADLDEALADLHVRSDVEDPRQPGHENDRPRPHDEAGHAVRDGDEEQTQRADHDRRPGDDLAAARTKSDRFGHLPILTRETVR